MPVPKFVNELYNEGATVVIRGRDSPGMLVGVGSASRTRFSRRLTNNVVVLKPDFETLMQRLKKTRADLWRSSGRLYQPSTTNRK